MGVDLPAEGRCWWQGWGRRKKREEGFLWRRPSRVSAECWAEGRRSWEGEAAAAAVGPEESVLPDRRVWMLEEEVLLLSPALLEAAVAAAALAQVRWQRIPVALDRGIGCQGTCLPGRGNHWWEHGDLLALCW